jgi:hypothetical protein
MKPYSEMSIKDLMIAADVAIEISDWPVLSAIRTETLDRAFRIISKWRGSPELIGQKLS